MNNLKMKVKDIITKSEIHFWVTIIGGVVVTLVSFFNLKGEFGEFRAETKKDIVTIKEDVGDIKNMMRVKRGTYGFEAKTEDTRLESH